MTQAVRDVPATNEPKRGELFDILLTVLEHSGT
jgi:hypothetical protein